MNTRCYRCGWSFSLSREEIEAAVAAAMVAGDKIHAERCPRCRQVIKLPVDQLRRTLPADWTPAERLAPVEPNPAATATEPGGPPTGEAAAAPVATAPAKPRRHHRNSGVPAEVEATEEAPEVKARSGKPAAGSPAAKKTARKQSTP